MERRSIFVIGDSVSVHYGPYLEKMVGEKFDYKRRNDIDKALENLDVPQGANAGNSNMVLKYLEYEFNKGTTYDILLVNCGLHDIRVDRETGNNEVDIWTYEKNLEKIAEISLKMSKKVFWMTMTPVVNKIHNARESGPLRFLSDVVNYNEKAKNVMRKYNIRIIDLFTFTKSLGTDIYCDHVHYKEDVRALQAAFITGFLFNDDNIQDN